MMDENTTDQETVFTIEENEDKKSLFDDIPSGEIDIDQYAENLGNTPKQSYESPNEETGEDTGEYSEEGPENTAEPKSRNAKANSELIVSLFDDMASFSLSIYAGEENADFYRAKESQKRALKDNLRRYLETQKDFELSPFWGVLIVALMAYAPVIRQAAIKGKQRKIYKQKLEEEKARQDEINDSSGDPFKSEFAQFGSSLDNINEVQKTTIIKNGKNKVLKTCLYCGKPHSNKTFCSRTCSANYQNVKHNAKN